MTVQGHSRPPRPVERAYSAPHPSSWIYGVGIDTKGIGMKKEVKEGTKKWEGKGRERRRVREGKRREGERRPLPQSFLKVGVYTYATFQ